MKHKQILKEIEKHKYMLGYGDWEFTVYTNQEIDSLANIEYDMWEKIATIKFSKDMEKKPKKFWKETIIHELIHGKIGLSMEKFMYDIKKLRYRKEEEFTNDIVRWYVDKGDE